MKNIKNQKSILKKLDKLNVQNNKTKQVYLTETLDGSKELTPKQTTQTQPIQTQPVQLIQQLQPIIQPMKPPQPTQPMTDPVYIRDNQVLNDKLYPPLGRTERPQFDLLMNFMNNQPEIFNMYTRGPPDTFRMLGYLTPISGTQTIDNTLILYGRAKWQNSDIGDFYATSSSKISDIKIPLTQYN